MLAAGITIESGNHPSGAIVGRSTPEKHFPQQDNGSFPVLAVYSLSKGPLDVTLYRQAGNAEPIAEFPDRMNAAFPVRMLYIELVTFAIAAINTHEAGVGKSLPCHERHRGRCSGLVV